MAFFLAEDLAVARLLLRTSFSLVRSASFFSRTTRLDTLRISRASSSRAATLLLWPSDTLLASSSSPSAPARRADTSLSRSLHASRPRAASSASSSSPSRRAILSVASASLPKTPSVCAILASRASSSRSSPDSRCRICSARASASAAIPRTSSSRFASASS